MSNPQNIFWTEERISLLKEFYPTMGPSWCVENLGFRSVRQVVCKASLLKIKVTSASEEMLQSRADHSKRLTGRKRHDQSLVMRKLIDEGKILPPTPAQRGKISVALKTWHSNNPHPRGMLGIKHSDASKDKMSSSGKMRWENMSTEEYEGYCMRSSINGQNSNPINREGASWKSGWREIGGKRKYFRSRWEANYARYLEWLKCGGHISEWEHEPETFWFEGIKRGCMSYLPDFRVIEANGLVVFHEVKGWMDDRSITKIKRMAKYHPNVKLIVIDSSSYKKLKSQMARMIDGWEE